MKGKIHSIETMGMVDGPGIRFVLFMQGCIFRCQFCHNPDTWDAKGGREIDHEEIIQDLESYLPYYQASGGGITISGGEPLMQAEFILTLFRECRTRGIHTALDTTGTIWNDTVDELLNYTDLVLLDLKEMNNGKHRELTGCYNGNVLSFGQKLSDRNIPVWIRHVLVPGLTDDPTGLKEMGQYVQNMKNVKRLELLPFHKMGEYKWQNLGIPYKLKDVQPPTPDEVSRAYQYLVPYVSLDKMPEKEWQK